MHVKTIVSQSLGFTSLVPANRRSPNKAASFNLKTNRDVHGSKWDTVTFDAYATSIVFTHKQSSTRLKVI